MLETLGNAQAQKTTDPKDSVFALFGIIQRMDPIFPFPDYSKNLEDIYTDIAKVVILNHSSLHILTRTEQHSTLSSLPSWVPNCRCAERNLPPLI